VGDTPLGVGATVVGWEVGALVGAAAVGSTVGAAGEAAPVGAAVASWGGGTLVGAAATSWVDGTLVGATAVGCTVGTAVEAACPQAVTKRATNSNTPVVRIRRGRRCLPLFSFIKLVKLFIFCISCHSSTELLFAQLPTLHYVVWPRADLSRH
jgi:hypothetical protein